MRYVTGCYRKLQVVTGIKNDKKTPNVTGCYTFIPPLQKKSI